MSEIRLRKCEPTSRAFQARTYNEERVEYLENAEVARALKEYQRFPKSLQWIERIESFELFGDPSGFYSS